MTSLFDTLHHICIVVHDVEKTAAYFEKLGAGPWVTFAPTVPYTELEMPNNEASRAMRYKWRDFGNFQVQLCEPPPGDSPQRRFLEQHGEGVYHLGFEVGDIDAAETSGRAQGLGVFGRGRRADGTGFCYFDTEAGAGVVLEVRQSQPTTDYVGS